MPSLSLLKPSISSDTSLFSSPSSTPSLSSHSDSLLRLLLSSSLVPSPCFLSLSISSLRACSSSACSSTWTSASAILSSLESISSFSLSISARILTLSPSSMSTWFWRNTSFPDFSLFISTLSFPIFLMSSSLFPLCWALIFSFSSSILALSSPSSSSLSASNFALSSSSIFFLRSLFWLRTPATVTSSALTSTSSSSIFSFFFLSSLSAALASMSFVLFLSTLSRSSAIFSSTESFSSPSSRPSNTTCISLYLLIPPSRSDFSVWYRSFTFLLFSSFFFLSC
mmetsp:Transcript_2961/g.5517  ORF Transcript_2961/g.5517 Transcript_2961/m.5517 type:complete len:283 (+) Transcript_2961:129-977(+)